MRASAFLPILVLANGAFAQSFHELTFLRDKPMAFSSFLKARAGVAGDIAENENTAIGHEDKTGFDGFLHYHNDRFTAQEAVFDAYAGRDGAVLGLRENNPGGSANRFEVTARYFPFYREGFYRSGEFIPTGRYEGDDYGAYAGIGNDAAEGLTVEIGVFYRRNEFDRNDDTSPSFLEPDDHNAFGVRLWGEHNTLVLDRNYGRPLDGFVLTAMLEREQNDSDKAFGTPIHTSELPSGLWRIRGHLEWFLPESDLGVWGFRADGAWTDEEDRVYAYDAQKPLGHVWIEGEVQFRFRFGGLSLTPFALGQFLRVLEENGVSADDELFFGGGVRLTYDLSETFSLYGDYSYLDNPSRPPVSASEDTWGEHQFFAGLEVVFGRQR